MTMCCCYGVEENECLIHSSIDSKADPWPAFVQESGDAPSEEGDGYTFATPGKIRLDHGTILHWDGSGFASGRSSYTGKDRKRLIGVVELNSDDACAEVTIMDDGAEHCKLRFVVHTPYIAKYPIVSVVRYSKRNNSFTSGIELDTQETILDKWQDGYRIKFYAGSEWTDGTSITAGSPVRYITAQTPVYIASSTDLQPIGFDTWTYFEWDTNETSSIWLECISGSVRVFDLELYHDAYTYNEAYVGEVIADGPTCLTGVSIPAFATLCNANGKFLANTMPGALTLILPTLSVNPDAEPFASTCGDCSFGGGDAIRMMINPDDAISYELYCAYQTSEAPIGCNETEPGVNFARFYPWFENEGAGIVLVDYEQDGDSELIGADIETLPGDNCPFAYYVCYTDGHNVTACNASVVLDHIGRSGLIKWQEWKNNLFGCMLAYGQTVDIELEDGIWTVA